LFSRKKNYSALSIGIRITSTLVNLRLLTRQRVQSTNRMSVPLKYIRTFWATVSKTVRPMLSAYQTVVCLSVCLSCPVCDVGVFWPNGWMDQDETWNAARPRPWPHCVRWGPSPTSPKGHSPTISSPYLLWPNGWMD